MTQRTLYIDPAGGASGDMILAALLDVGVAAEVVSQALVAVGLDDVEIEVRRESRHAIAGLRVVFIDAQGQAVDPREHAHHGHHEHTHAHSLEPMHTPWSEISQRLRNSTLKEPVKQLALRLFSSIAVAEAKVHATDVNDVTLHELGGVDSIADIVGIAAAVDALGLDAIHSGPIPLGSGHTHAAHGVLPLPAPVTALLCVGAAVRGIEADDECTTPTGAAVLAGLATRFGHMPDGVVRAVGVGLGHRDPATRANLLRAFIVDTAHEFHVDDAEHDELVELCCNLDDETGEHCGEAIAQLMECGAVDAWVVPAVMKKGRPAFILHALVQLDAAAMLSRVLLTETSTLGVRQHAVERHKLQRYEKKIMTAFGEVHIKYAALGDKTLKLKAEFDDCRAIARQHGIPVRDIIAIAERVASEELS